MTRLHSTLLRGLSAILLSRVLLGSVLLGGLVACGGGSTSDDPNSLLSAGSTSGPGVDGKADDATSLFKECFSTDIGELTEILDLFQGFLGEDGELDPTTESPLPEFDLLDGLLNGGDFEYTWDLNDDGVSEVTGTIRFVDDNGSTTLPFNVIDLLLNPPESIEDVLGLVKDRAQLEMSFEMGGLLLSTGTDASGAGKLVFDFVDGAIDSLSGSGAFESGPCLLDFSFDDITVSLDALDGIPEASFEFDATIGDDSLHGSIEIGADGVATVTAQLNDDPEETLELDLNDLGEYGDYDYSSYLDK